MGAKWAVAERTARLNEFVTAWRVLTHRPVLDVGRLASFLDAARERLRVPPPTLPTAPKVDVGEFELVLGTLRVALNNARSHGLGFNPWTVAGLRRNEVRAAGVLAALWNPTMCGDAAAKFLREFVGELRGIDALPDEGELGQGYVVRTEHMVQGDPTTRMDITIEGKRFVLVIEVKIDAPEGKDDQFTRIRAQTKAWAEDRGKRPLFVLLLPRTPPGGVDDAHADWRAVARAARRCMPRERASYTFHDHMLAGFADHIISF
jgi:PD-(D/E)XK nuclease superfamily